MAVTLSDDAVRAAQDGDELALNTVYRELSPAVHGYLVSRGAHDPEGLTSEVFLAVIPRLPTITGGAAGLRTFVFSVAHARMVDEARYRARRSPTVPYEHELDPRTEVSAETLALVNDEQAQALRMLAQLPADQAEVVRLRVLADLSIEQVAVILGRSPGAVKQLQRRGLLTLRTALYERGVTP